MALLFLSKIIRRDLGPVIRRRRTLRLRPTYALPSISQGGSGNGARANVARKTKEVEHMLANLEKEEWR
ncbi:hypothetical protein EJB05_40116, partial [Eragrostis curvula]